MPTKFIMIIVGGLIIVLGLLLVIKLTKSANPIDQKGDHQDDLTSYEISPGEVVEKIKNKEDVVLLDVRTIEEYEEGHLQGAVLVPVQELSSQTLAEAGLWESAKDKEIIIYCRSGARSQTAFNIMKSLGYTNIKSVAGGLVHWQEDGYPFLEAGAYKGNMTAQASESLTKGPKIFLEENFYDFGIVPQLGGVVKKTFTVKNTGTEVLKIGDITTSCSCTSAVIDTKNILPGQETKVTVVFDPNFHDEPTDVFKRTVFIPSNDHSKPEVEIIIKVDIKEEK